eukprot:12088930-Alexandrium_andersonii.AAC.1
MDLITHFVVEKTRRAEFQGKPIPDMQLYEASARHFAEGVPEPWAKGPAGAAPPHPFDAPP